MEKTIVSNYDKFPVIAVEDKQDHCWAGWEEICRQLNLVINQIHKEKKIIVIDCYQGVDHTELEAALRKGLQHDHFVNAKAGFKSEDEITRMVYPDVTDDRVFGYMTRLTIQDYFDEGNLQSLRNQIAQLAKGVILVYGEGAAYVAGQWDLLVYADMARWEIQQRMRRNEVGNLGLHNVHTEFALQYKQCYFVDWRVCDKHKRTLMNRWDYLLDTNQPGHPNMVTGKALQKGLAIASQRPFRVVPFFDPGPWGGQWMKEVCDLDRSAENYAWGFDCVPEENSMLLGFGAVVIEIPSINLVFTHPEALLGQKVHAQFGEEFPIRFDFLDTMEGGNLSLQVHPTQAYIKEKFGMDYTQDESYYFLDAKAGAHVYLGLNENINPEKMIEDLKAAQKGGPSFQADQYVQKWDVKKHDHVHIPAGTVHCSGKDSMVLEISATPYIFTFKLWDWGRLGLDGKPRPINIEHGEKVIQWDRTKSWTRENIINGVRKIAEGDGWIEEKTGLHESQFIETRRHWFTGKVTHHTQGGVNVLNLVEGREVIVESPTHAFEPFVVHYAETFIVPAAVGAYTIRPYGEAEGSQCATIKAFVRV